MSFEMHGTGTATSESPPSLINEAMDHVRTTWKNVMNGNASAGEYAEAAVEGALCVAVGAFALKQGARFLGLGSRAASSGANLGMHTAESVGVLNPATDALIHASKTINPFNRGVVQFAESAIPIGVSRGTAALSEAAIPIGASRGAAALTEAAIPIGTSPATDALLAAALPINPRTRAIAALTDFSVPISGRNMAIKLGEVPGFVRANHQFIKLSETGKAVHFTGPMAPPISTRILSGLK